MNKPLRIIDEYHDHPRPGYMLPVWSQDREGYFIQVPPIQQNDEELSLERRWSREEICSYLGVPAEMLKPIKANEQESHEMFLTWLKSNPPIRIGVDLVSGTDKTVIRKVDPYEHSTGQ